MMMPYRTFSRRSGTPLKERRRRRWSDTVATFAAVAGVVLDQAARRDADLFPPSWRPYILAASLAFMVIATVERIERRHDYNRYVRRINGCVPSCDK